MDAKYGFVMSGTMTAMTPVRPVFIFRAARFGTNPSRETAASTRRLRFGRHLLRSTQRTRHRCRMHASFGRHVENGDASGLSHGTVTLLAGR